MSAGRGGLGTLNPLKNRGSFLALPEARAFRAAILRH